MPVMRQITLASLFAAATLGMPPRASILRRNPQISVGVHLVLNSEWKGDRWGPVLGKEGRTASMRWSAS